MTGLYLLLPTLLVVVLSFLVVRAGAIALMMTGMDQQKANFQALSAFTRTGFTTREAELVVNHPQRRRIITWLIIIGNAGFVAVIITATSSIVASRGYTLAIILAVLFLGIYIVYRLARYTPLVRRWERFVENRLIKSPIVEEATTEDLLHLTEDYGLVRVIIKKDSPFVGYTLAEAYAPDSKLRLLGVERGRKWIPLPQSQEIINEGDRLVLYGELAALKHTFQSEQK